LLYCQEDLQKYILLYCQEEKGGLVDKPGKMRDCYHTTYAMAGLSCSQEFGIVLNQSKIKKIDPIYNVVEEKLKDCQ
jgi:prenyltransferase beta subunit